MTEYCWTMIESHLNSVDAGGNAEVQYMLITALERH